jgi:hypothetical protein
VTLVCEPTSTGAKIATLDITTNDADEGTNVYSLTCNGVSNDLVFEDDFEGGP